jgi:hypothetical protein
MTRRSLLPLLTLVGGAAAALAILSIRPVLADDDDQGGIVGVWECTAARPDSTTFPIYQTFHGDGTVQYSSGSTLFNAGFSSRGGANGMWRRTGRNLYNFKAVELLYKNVDEGSMAGLRDVVAARFYVDQTVQYDRGTDSLCGGLSDCPEATINIKRLLLGCNPGDTCDNFNVHANLRCHRLAAGFPSIP